MPVFLLPFLLLFSAWSHADWQLQPEYSRLSLTSVTRGEMAEVQRFKGLSGVVDAQGEVRLLVPLEGLDSGSALRDERMKEHLFDAPRFPQVEISASVDLEHWQRLAVGSSEVVTQEFTLDLHGYQRRLKAELLVSRVGEERLLVTTLEPVVLKVVDYGLSEGLGKLLELGGVPSISGEVPVSVVLSFRTLPELSQPGN